MNRYKVEHKMEGSLTNSEAVLPIWYVMDMTPQKGRYPIAVARIYDEKLAEIACESFNKFRKISKRGLNRSSIGLSPKRTRRKK